MGKYDLRIFITSAIAYAEWKLRGDLDTGIRNDRDMKALTVELVKFSPEKKTDDETA